MLWIGVVHEYEYGERDTLIAILISRFENLMLVLKVGLEKFLLHFTGSLLQVELNFGSPNICVPSRLDRVEQDIFDRVL